MNKKRILISAAVLYLSHISAQQSQFYNNREQYHLNLAENLYHTKIYNASQFEYAQQYFYNKRLSNSNKEANKFFDNVIAVILQKHNSEAGLESFVKQYPNSTYFSQANLPLADYYLLKKDFEKALKTLKNVNQYQLSRDENSEYILKVGYSKFMLGDSKGAIHALEEAYVNGDPKYKNEVGYMLGHLHYANREYETSLLYFNEIKTDLKFSKLVRPYYVQMFYNEKKYDLAITEGKELLNEDLSLSYKAEVHKIIGESFFMQGNYSEAYPHLKTFFESNDQPSESDLYQLGFVAAQLHKYEEAVSYYNQLINEQSALSQNAYYQLGNAYFLTEKKQEALSAFRSAYQMNYDSNVKKLAHEQYAKLGYDIGNPFENPSKVIQEFIDIYPKDSQTQQMKDLLIKSYLYSGDYKQTLDAIDRLKEKSPEIDKINQEVSFLLGTEEFNKGNLDKAEQFYTRSIQFNYNKEFYYRANYWLGQTYYQKGDYSSAIEKFESVAEAPNFTEKQQVQYDLGYAYFKMKNFDLAKKSFKAYLTNPKQEFKSDAQLRLADVHYANNELTEAIAIYNSSEIMTDYILFQKAMAVGFQGNTPEKIKILKSLISKYSTSEYVDDAQYEMGVAYASDGDYTSSNEYFTKVLNSSKDATLVANSQIYRAQNFIDQGQDSKAISEFKLLANQYKNTAFAEKVVQASRPLYIKNGDAAGYEKFAQSVGINLSSSEKDELNLTSAKTFYAQKNYKSAIPLFEKYLSQNPTGENMYMAMFELGESYYQTKNSSKAMMILNDVASAPNDYQYEALTRVSQIQLAQGNTKDAKNNLLILSQQGHSNMKNFANAELMNLYADENKLTEAVKFADLILADTKNSSTLLEKAKTIKARNFRMSGKDKDAQSLYSSLEKSSNTEVAAEALFAKAYYQNKSKSFKQSNETIFKLANNYASEEYWGAKALLVMAKNYIGLKDNYQASYTIDQIIANYKDFPDIISEAKDIKKDIK